LSKHQEALTAQWEQLCTWFKSKAAQAVSRTQSRRAKGSILYTAAQFCSDEPPKTFEGFQAFRKFAQGHVALWETAPLPKSSADLSVITDDERT
jgi:hypothetical protein